MKKIITIVLVLALLLPSCCSADDLDSIRARYNIKASYWGAPKLPDTYSEAPAANGSYYFFMLDKITVAFSGPRDDIVNGYVFYDEGADVGSFLYSCMAMATTVISSVSYIDIGGFIITGFTLCKHGESAVPYYLSGYAAMDIQENQIVFSCMDY